MATIVWSVSLIIQALAIIMVVYTFYRISEKKFPKLDALEKYHLMRKRYERLRMSLLFIGALIVVQLIGLFFYAQSGSLALQLLISDLVIIALAVFLSGIYKGKNRLGEIEELEKKK